MTTATRDEYYDQKHWERRRSVFRLLRNPAEASEQKKDVANILRAALNRAGLTQTDLMEALYAICEIDWDKANISRALSGEQLPSADKIEAMTLVIGNLTNEEEAMLMALVPGYRPVCQRYWLAWMRVSRPSEAAPS